MLLMPHVYEEVTRNNHLWELKAVMIYFWHRKGMEQNSDVTHNSKVNKHTLIPFTDKTSSKSANIWVPSSLCIFFTLTFKSYTIRKITKGPQTHYLPWEFDALVLQLSMHWQICCKPKQMSGQNNTVFFPVWFNIILLFHYQITWVPKQRKIMLNETILWSIQPGNTLN